jgi:hypothetical protein
MVDDRLKSLVFQDLAKLRIIETFAFSPVVYRPLPFSYVFCCWFWTQISQALIRFERGESL